MSYLALAILLPGATIALMLALAAHNRRTGWRRKVVEEAPGQPSGVWMLARQVQELENRRAPVFRPFPRLSPGPESPPEVAALALPLVNLEQALGAAAAGPARMAQPDLRQTHPEQRRRRPESG